MSDLRHPCKSWAEPISLAAAGCLPPGEQQEVHRHIEACPACRERFGQLTQLCGAIVEAQLPADGAEAAIVERVMSAVAPDQSRRPSVSTQPERIHPSLLARTLNTWRWVMRSPVSRIAAMVGFILVVTGVAVWFHSGGATFAFADLIRPILEAKTVKFKQSIEMKGPTPTIIESQWMVLDATRLRMETKAPHGLESVQITDWSKGKSLSLYPATKHATILEYANTKNGRNDPSWWLRLLQMAQDNKTKGLHCEPLGEKQLDGRRVVGFRISTDHGPPLDLWGDPKTELPVRVEMTTGMDGNTKATMSDFVFNAELDESLFSVEPPAGYTVDHQKADTSPDKEKDLIEMFRQYTKLCRGVFPDSLDSRTVTWAFWKTYNIKSQWDHIANAPGMGNVDKEQGRKFEEQMGKIMDEMNDAMMAGKTDKEQTRKFAEQMGKITSKFVAPRITRMTWEGFAPEKFKATEEQRRRFEKQMHKMMEDGRAEKQGGNMGEEIFNLLTQMFWENLAPATLKASEEKRHKFEELMRKMGGKPDEKVKEEFRKVFGDQMLKDVEAWEAEVAKAGKAREAQDAGTRKDDQKARSQAFMEAQRQVGRGVAFANRLSPSADAHYAGKGVSLGATDTPIFWYRPNGAKKYRVIYADLSVHDANAPPNVAKAQPIPTPSGPKK